MAVLVENPLYLYDKANVHMTFYIDDRQVNEFCHTMAMEERRNVYYVPLNILDNVKLTNKGHTSVKIDVVDENIKGNIYSIEPDIYYGDTDPADVFTLHEVSIYDDYTGAEGDVFDLGRLESLHMRVSVNYTDHYGPIGNIDGVVTISPSDSTNRRNTLVRSIFLDDLSSLEGYLEGNNPICNVSCVFSNTDSIPFFKPEPSKYVVNFFLLDALLWSREIEFVEASEEDTDEDIEDESESERAIFETVILRTSESPAPQEDRVVLAKDVESFVWQKLSTKIGF